MKTRNIFNIRSTWMAALLLIPLISACGDGGGSAIGTGPVPTILETSPLDTAIAVPINSNVAATFSAAMNSTSINTTNFTVVGAGETALAGTVSLDAASNTATFNPTGNMTVSKLYTATLTTGVKSALGMALANNYVWSFTTGTTADTTAPTVLSTNPANAATAVVLGSTVSANFSEALAPATVNATTFTLKQGATSVAGTVSYSNKVATFTPAANLTASKVYTATLTTGITDLVAPANALAANVVWSFTTGTTATAAGPAAVNLRTAGNFVILTKTGVTNVHTSAISGNVGASPITAAAMNNVFCSEITGTIYGADAAYTGSGAVTCFAGTAADNTLVANAILDMGTAYADASGRTTPDFTELGAGNISGLTLVPGLYKWGTTVNINTNVTLSGGPNDVWIFQIAGDLIQANGTSVLLIGGALPKNIFWQVAGLTGATIGTTAVMEGVVLAAKAIAVSTTATVHGRLLAQTAVTLDQNTITQPAP
ncbi:MAG: hypothetical protein COS82_07320 [Zetaproteobacteria bacterium CG06_land_8_20_14_3_00_59_53]|nr:MAG: hypothetical protein COX56_09785 [Zetaproteobacteria bacterium CG23_combo_of_CG06-09_8_20_14_all_59_86]PIQ65698.1 MAG: hypothetical protein COV97_02280 [Zetaproteobacteria bacterium CG11_big_fil_rev_8_21_14_0_20_59_439]PIU70220.1 MAG: hypothetical protein COS82_07320 [Zetaproteobacteria bacterium CG06_land_8_20_14_3_00_59_53]PIU96186.1 MAG: hypothetical protein COS62_10250 [Zetaproteobacteria bacterium CG03_land_8_20_14_0_80_59_51]